MALWNKTIFHQCCSTARRCSPWSSHSHENSTSRPHQNHQDFIARIHGMCIATVCMHQPCLSQGVILTNSHASMRQSKTRFWHCLRVSGTTSCVHLKDLRDHFCAAIKFQNSQGDVANNRVSFRFHFNHGLISIKRFRKASSKRLRSSWFRQGIIKALAFQANSSKALSKHLRFIHWVEVIKLHSNIIGTFKFRFIRFSQISFSSYLPNIVPSQGHWGCRCSACISMSGLTACSLAITQC